jgi:DNA-binding beta-propeller fold protein YncE
MLAAVWAFACAPLAAQSPFPANSTALPSHPFFIKNTWVIGGTGDWDYLTMDARAGRLYIAHGPEVQVVDVETGKLVGSVSGLQEAHSIALDANGDFGYVSDGKADEVAVFDRRSFKIVARIPTGPSPRAIALDPSTDLLAAICAGKSAPEQTPTEPQGLRRPAPRLTAPKPAPAEQPKTVISIIDVESRTQLAQVLVAGHLGFTETDANGDIYIAAPARNAIAQLDLDSLAAEIHPPASPPKLATNPAPPPQPARPQVFDWSDPAHLPASADDLRYDRLGPDCSKPNALTVDRKDRRVFVACDNLRLAVLNTVSGEVVTTLPIGPGPESVGYDPDRNLIFVANGGSDGSLTIVRRDATDSYDVIQTLPTRQQARTLAVNSSTGQVYLVTVFQVAKLGTPPLNGIGTLKLTSQGSSFQVLVVGN